MRKTIVCLANSKKYGERCIAGVEITEYDGTSYSVVRHDSRPKWIRPVSNRDHGEVSVDVVARLQLLDVFEIEVTAEAPQGYQSENVLFEESTLKIIGSLDRTPEQVQQFQMPIDELLFGNRGKAVHVDAIDQVPNSLVLIHAGKVHFNEITYPNGKHQVRGIFDFAETRYDLPVTDVDFLSGFQPISGGVSLQDCYLTISLGVEHNSFHSKLIAAVVIFS